MTPAAVVLGLALRASAAIGNPPSTTEFTMVPQFGHSNSVHRVAVSPRGDFIASASTGADFKLWRRDGVLVRDIPHDGAVLSVAFSSDGTRLYWTMWHRGLAAQAVSGGEVTHFDEASKSIDYRCKYVSVSDDGRLIWTVTQPGDLTVRDANGGPPREIRQLYVDYPPKIRNHGGSHFHEIPIMVPFFVTLAIPIPGTEEALTWSHFDGSFARVSATGSVEAAWYEERKIGGASVSSDGSLVLVWPYLLDKDPWQLDLRRVTGELMAEVHGHGAVTGAVFLPGHEGFCVASDEISCFDLQGKPISEFVPRTRPLTLGVFPDGALLVGHSDGTLSAYSREGALLTEFGARPEKNISLAVESDGRRIAVGSEPGEIALWRDDGSLLDVLKTPSPPDAISFSPDGALLAVGGRDGMVRLFRLNGEQVSCLHECKPFSKDGIRDLAFSADSSRLAIADGRRAWLWERASGRLQAVEIPDGSQEPPAQVVVIDPPPGVIQAYSVGTPVQFYDSKNKKSFWVIESTSGRHQAKRVHAGSAAPPPREFTFDPLGNRMAVSDWTSVQAVAFDPSGSRLAVSKGSSIYIYDSKIHYVDKLMVNKLNQWNAAGMITRVTFLGEGGGVCAATKWGELLVWEPLVWAPLDRTLGMKGRHMDIPAAGVGTVRVGDGWGCVWIPSNSPVIRGEGNHSTQAGPAAGLAVTADGLRVVTASKDGSVHVWNKKTDGEMTLLRSGRRWAMFSRDGFFDASGDGGSLVAMASGTEVFGVDQFAVWNNRPDLMLSRLEMGDPTTIRDFAEQHRRRAARLGSSGERPAGPLHAPKAEVSVEGAGDGWADVTVACAGEEAGIASWRLWDNDVPVGDGESGASQSRTFRTHRRIGLVHGANKLEASCVDRAGVESLRAQTVIGRAGPRNGRVFYLGVGVSRYADPAISLKYADKDAMDLGKAFTRAERGTTQVVSRILVNEHATRKALRDARTFLESADIDDTLIVYLAGHGLHAGEGAGDFYFLPHDAAVGSITKTAVSFDEIEGLLGGLRARRKLLLIDACESGELDDSDDLLLAKGPGSRGLRPRVSRDIRLRLRPIGRRRGTRLWPDRYIYNDLIRRTGAVAFSSSRGFEQSYESETLKNGLFSSAIIQALGTQRADRNKDGRLSKAELLEFVASEVAKESGGRQHPVIDRDNIVETLDFPLVPR